MGIATLVEALKSSNQTMRNLYAFRRRLRAAFHRTKAKSVGDFPRATAAAFLIASSVPGTAVWK